MNRIRRIAAVVALVVLMAGPLGLARAAPLETGRWVAIGPAPTVNGSTDYTEPASGRLTGIAAHPTDANIIYIAAAGGGVWKTTTGGATWSPLTDTQSTLFMGAIALAPSNPDVIYAGTGEANMGPSKAREVRDNIYYGLGVLKSTDAGRTWTLLGSQHFARRTISKIVVDPADPNIVYAAVGALATNGLAGNTGIWKSIDGGQIWTNTTGAISTTAAFSDIVMDPTDQRMLYAGVGAPGGDPANGVYKTTDAGRSWSRAAGFAGDPRIGRIALAISSKTSAGGGRWLYAAVASTGPPHAPANSLYELRRTSDGGNRWEPLLTVANKFLPLGGDDRELSGRGR